MVKPSPLGPATGDRWVPSWLLGGLLGYMALSLAWLALGASFAHETIGDLAFLPLTALAAYACWQAGERAGKLPGMRSGWRLIGLAMAAYGLGDAVQLAYEAATGELPPVSLADPLYLAFYPLFLAGILQFPWVAGARGHRTRALLDGITIALGGSAIVWYVVLGPTAYSGATNLLENLAALAYPVGDLILIGALAWLWTGGGPAQIRHPLGLLSLGLLLFVTGDVLYTWTVLHERYAGGDWLDALWLLAIAAFVLAGSSQPVLEDSQGRPDTAAPGWIAALPYAAALAVFVMLIGSQAKDSFFPGLSLTLTGALVVILVLGRQYLVQRELVTTNDELRGAQAELAALATTDPLTGLPNHRALADAMARELDRARRFQRPCSLLFVDIDYFKALNDGCGHAAGDSVLRELGEVLAASLRRVDTLGRWGGEEFVAVLPEVGAATALATAERLRANVAEHVFPVASGTHLTVSIGAATYGQDGLAPGTLLEAADRAMYAAKRMGRNQVFSASDPVVAAVGQGEDGTDADERAAMGAVDALALLVDSRDKGTGEHVAHVAHLAERVALSLGASPKEAREVALAAKLHDIGKVAVADSILRNPGRLDANERELMRRHPAIGADVVSRVGRLASLAPIIRSHHEHFDGNGYPAGLRGEEIPLAARIVAAADAVDAMTSDRPYRRHMDIEQARRELKRAAGTQFDPKVVEALDEILAEEAEQALAAKPSL